MKPRLARRSTLPDRMIPMERLRHFSERRNGIVNAHRFIKSVLIGSFIFTAILGVALVLAARSNGTVTAQIAQERGVLSAFADSNGAERYRLRSISVDGDSTVEPCGPYCVIVLRKTADIAPAGDGGGAYDCKWDSAWTEKGKFITQKALTQGTVAFVVIGAYERQAYLDEQGKTLWGEREKAEIYVYDIASETFVAHTTLYGAEFAESYVIKIGAGDFTNTVTHEDIDGYMISLTARD
jgi:hypothetical protein